MRITDSAAIPGLRRIEPSVFRDERGEFVETWNADDYAFAGAFVEDDLSVSRKGVLRGLHGDNRTWRLVQCVAGAMYVVVADVRDGARQWEGFDLSAHNRLQVLVPPGCATGLAALEDPSILLYKQTERYRGPEGQFTVRWDDPSLDIEWPIDDPMVSDRDRNAPDL